MPQRLKQLNQWLQQTLTWPTFEICPASDDASFRRYFRVTHGGRSLIAVDAPPDKEDSHPFVHIAGGMADLGLQVPKVVAHDLEQGFMLLSDLGQTQYLEVLNRDTATELYGAAITALVRLQRGATPERLILPDYDAEMLQAEMALFPDWLLGRHLDLKLDRDQKDGLVRVFDLLVESALQQPTVCVHRDYHSRNLMVMGADGPGILDFQDAVWGALTYDLVSLLRDCYIVWPRERVEAWVSDYHRLAASARVIQDVSLAQLLRWFDWMGVQRHLKVAGIFARLWHRDGKSGYLADIPLTLDYLVEVTSRYPELLSLNKLIVTEVQPRWEASVIGL